jgi:hypothetical protein
MQPAPFFIRQLAVSARPALRRRHRTLQFAGRGTLNLTGSLALHLDPDLGARRVSPILGVRRRGNRRGNRQRRHEQQFRAPNSRTTARTLVREASVIQPISHIRDVTPDAAPLSTFRTKFCNNLFRHGRQ